MINFETQFERMDKEYDKMYEKYLEFKENTNYTTRKSLVMQMKRFTESKTKFIVSVKNLNLKIGNIEKN